VGTFEPGKTLICLFKAIRKQFAKFVNIL